MFTGSGYTPVFHTKISFFAGFGMFSFAHWASCMAVIWVLQGLVGYFIPITCSLLEFPFFLCPGPFHLLHSTLIWFYQAAGDQHLLRGFVLLGASELGVPLQRLARASMVCVVCGISFTLSLDWYLMKDSRPLYRLHSARCASNVQTFINLNSQLQLPECRDSSIEPKQSIMITARKTV